MPPKRKGSVRRETKETKVTVEMNLDGSGQVDIATGIGMLDHLLEQLPRHSLFDITIQASGDIERDPHHLIEDIGIGLGRALSEALGERRSIVRMGHAVVPLDEALALVAVDLSGRGHAAVELPFTSERIGELPTEMIAHHLAAFAVEGRFNLHVRVLAGTNDHHKAEAAFKALARALGDATRIDPRISDIPSTKGKL
ncbi:MAG: imidazoleglycerol-phosphate dehydratase HisB [Dehalococcoidia bacterium]|nr:MAG: imidazoleglycerol-phosphate dehydratase HisB [Dehalococcoidia bacterium]